ncbi:MAG TPA: glycosyltransferase family 4 protein [Vicinamibacterales bacterium]|nr:glycosyltransferase family 4 protein [Vicinamibacterales bacterium]
MVPCLAIIATHPIQYHVPWYRALAARTDLHLHVFFAALPDPEAQGTGFGQPFSWDLPLLEGYRSTVLKNRRRRPRLNGFFASSAPAYRALEQLRPAAVVITGWHQWPMLQALGACRRLRIPTIVRAESNSMRPRLAGVRFIHRRLLRMFDAFLAIGTSNRDFYERAGVPSERILDCPYFVDNERFAEDAARLATARRTLRRSWGIADDATVFAFVGKLQRKKRPADVIEAASIARARGAEVHVLVVGGGTLEAQLRSRAAEARLPITFAGFLNQSEVAKAYVACDALVLPSDYGETWGLVVNEAMACGRPALVSDRVGCGPDLIREGETGHVFPFADREALAELMVRLSACPGTLRVMGERARRHVMQGFSIDRAVCATARAVMVAAR